MVNCIEFTLFFLKLLLGCFEQDDGDPSKDVAAGLSRCQVSRISSLSKIDQ